MSDSTKYFIYASLFFLVSSLFCLPAYASSCWLGQSATLSLGTSNAQGSALVSTDVIADCYFNSNQPVTYKLCLVADSFDPVGSTPRSMIIYNPVRALLNYELYSDAARTFKIPDSERKNQAQCQTFQFEAGTGNIADAVGLGAAIDYVSKIGIENIYKYEHELLEYAISKMTEISGLRLIGTAKEKTSVLSFVLDGYETQKVGEYLTSKGIALRFGHHCAQPILRRFGVETTVRPSNAFYNTKDEIDFLVATIKEFKNSHFRG